MYYQTLKDSNELISQFCIYLPGQLFELHEADSDDDPEQLIPPCCGDGLSHDLTLVLVPPPHVRLQAL